ncbi:MAG: Kdo hydroxylase family protein, partial [Acidobacteriales bacterium]|nr:Kdo hydroxylase family protein [Terriglobales bacterium]
QGWSGAAPTRAHEYCRALEQGSILCFQRVPFDLPVSDREFLISQRQSGSRFHKNISYRPQKDVLRGTSTESAEDSTRLRRIMREYSQHVTEFVRAFLVPYAAGLALDFASFRPQEEEGRDLPLHKRNDLLHVDAFPTRPTRGARILRVFTNINPSQSRVWLTGKGFHHLAPKYAEGAGLRGFAAAGGSPVAALTSVVTRGLHSIGLPVAHRSAYDRFMLHFHDWLKENAEFQQDSAHIRSEFPSGCTWMVFTDGVPHAALSGRFALEHTYIIPRHVLVAPEFAPISVLEKLCGQTLTA